MNDELSCRDLRGHIEHAAGNPSAPSGQLPLHKGAFFQPRHPTASLTPSAAYPHKQGAVFNCPGILNLFHRRTKGRCPRGEHLLGALWFFLAARKNKNHAPRHGNHAANCNLQSCHDATQPTPLKLLPLSPQGTPLPYEGKFKTPKRYRKTYSYEPSQSPAVTALPEGEPRGGGALIQFIIPNS